MVNTQTPTAYGWTHKSMNATATSDYCISEWKSMMYEVTNKCKLMSSFYDDDYEGTASSLYNCNYGTTSKNAKYRIMSAATNQFIEATNWIKWSSCDYEVLAPKTPAEKLRDIIQQRHAPVIIVAGERKPLETPTDFREICARQTIRRVLGEDDYRGYVKDGFVSVRGKSGLVYQIYPAHGITRVYRDGVMVERLCVVLKGNFPPTDSLIMRYLLILNDENDFRKHAITHQIMKPKTIQSQIDNRSLVEIYKGLKVAG